MISHWHYPETCLRWIGLACLSATVVASQTVDQGGQRNLARAGAANQEPGIPPLPPVDFFRQLLAMSPLDRELALAAKQPEKRKALRAKIDEYTRMPAAERERRLRMTELRFFLMPLMRLPPAERSGLLESVPARLQQLVAVRLQQWDLLPEPFQKEVIDHEITMHYFARLESSTPAEREQILRAFPKERREILEAELQKWSEMPREDRQRMYEGFGQFFDLPPEEKEKALDVLSEEERRQMEKALLRFGKLPSEQRETFIQSFQKFANMTEEERDQFLRNAERWRAMSSRERQTWINLINILPVQSEPPLPPGVNPSAKILGSPGERPGGNPTGKPPPLPGSGR